ncbi:hypothetical protein Tco_0625733 [Tanacetum coccineum]|uniref:Uncharacterized protein n=1 Tax=Tanacetum coccineum TaxID=301880 RepID=A0ABQ4WHN4_9ASTR
MVTNTTNVKNDQGVGSTSGIKACALRNFDLEVMELKNTQNNALAKLSMLKLGDLMLMALPNEHQLTFDQYVDAQSMFAAIKARFGGNEATKKTQKALFETQYENSVHQARTRTLDSIFETGFPKALSLPSEWDTHVVVWMNKPDFDTMGLDDLYNNFKIVEQKVKKSVGTNNDDKNLAFLTTSGASSTNNINIANPEVSTGTTKGINLVNENLEQLHDDELKKIDLKWNHGTTNMMNVSTAIKWDILPENAEHQGVKHNMVAFLEKSTGSLGSDEATTDDNGEVQITATIDGHSMTITEASLRRHLKLDDHDGITSIPNSKIFEQLALMGYHTDTYKFIQICLDMQRKQLQQHSRTYPVPSLSIKVFNNMNKPTKGYSGQEVALFPTMLDASEPATSPSRIKSSPSYSPEPLPLPEPSFKHSPAHTTAAVTQPSPTQPSPTQPSPT